MLKHEELITCHSWVVMKAANEFQYKPSHVNEKWQTDTTYLKIKGWGWYCLSIILADYGRYVIAWKLCNTIKAKDVTDTLDLAILASGHDGKIDMPRLLPDNDSSYVAEELADLIKNQGYGPCPWQAVSSTNAGKDPTLASDKEEPDACTCLLRTWVNHSKQKEKNQTENT